MSTELDLDDLKKMRQELFNTIEFVKNEAGNARDNGKINDQQFQQAQVEWGKLETKELELQGLIMALQLDFLLNTNVDSPRSRIIQATERLKTAAQNIEIFGNFLSEIAKVIDIFADTIKAIQTGGILTLPT
jgi:hypothetical protein